MKPTAKPAELVRFSDGSLVIVGAHLTLEEAQSQFGEEYGEEEFDYEGDQLGKISSVKHWWIRYEFIGEDNCPEDFEPEKGDRCWILREQEKRPGGCVKRATVINR